MKVRLEGLTFSYGGRNGPPVLSDVTLELPEGGITVAVGPSGSGKSTLLQLLAGLLQPDAGAVLFDGEDVTRLPAEKRNVGFVFQSYALFPHLTVRENIAFGLRTSRPRLTSHGLRRLLSARQIESRVWDVSSVLALERLLDRRPCQLSGGEQQRVALARAVAPRPDLLLLDEPLSALDPRLRRSLRSDLALLLRKLGTTALYVTHDQQEAMLLADHLVVLEGERGGRIVQAGLPLDLYRHPASPFVASFLGEANLLEVALEDGELEQRTGLLEAILGSAHTASGEGEEATSARHGWLLVRPEDLNIHPSGAPAVVLDSRGVGPYDRVLLRFPGGAEILAHLPPDTAPVPGATLRVLLRSGRSHFLPAEP